MEQYRTRAPAWNGSTTCVHSQPKYKESLRRGQVLFCFFFRRRAAAAAQTWSKCYVYEHVCFIGIYCFVVFLSQNNYHFTTCHFGTRTFSPFFQFRRFWSISWKPKKKKQKCWKVSILLSQSNHNKKNMKKEHNKRFQRKKKNYLAELEIIDLPELGLA